MGSVVLPDGETVFFPPGRPDPDCSPGCEGERCPFDGLGPRGSRGLARTGRRFGVAVGLVMIVSSSVPQLSWPGAGFSCWKPMMQPALMGV